LDEEPQTTTQENYSTGHEPEKDFWETEVDYILPELDVESKNEVAEYLQKENNEDSQRLYLDGTEGLTGRTEDELMGEAIDDLFLENPQIISKDIEQEDPLRKPGELDYDLIMPEDVDMPYDEN